MSWQGYVDNLMATKHMTHCGIFGLDGSTWAISNGSPLTPENIKLVISGLIDPSKFSNGITVGGDRYILVRSDPGVLVILKKGPNGIVALKSNQSVIIALHDSTVKAEQALTDIGRVIDYLSRHGY